MEEEKKTGTPTEKLLATAQERYKRGLESETRNREEALEAVKFRNGEQWDERLKHARLNDPEGSRPCPVVDKVNQYLRQLINDEKQNRPSIKVRPVDDKGDAEVAEIIQGLVRHIEDISGADLAYDTAYEHSADGGFGYFRVLTEYADSKSFDQDIKLKRIRNRFQVILDDSRQEPDGSDSQWGFIVEKMRREEFEAKYPKADPCDFDSDGKVYAEWVRQDHILVAEYFHFVTEEATLCLWESGAVSIKGKVPKTDYIGDRIVKERKTTLKKLKWDKITAKEILESRDLPGEFIPIVEVIGEEIDIEGKSHKNGLLKRAMEPQRIHNYAAASFIENVALAPKAPWVVAAEQIEGREHDWRTANRRNLAVLTYKPVVMEGNVPVPPPQRAQPPGIPIGWQQTLQNSEHDIQSSMGMYAETTLGMGDANSGKQEAMQQRRGDTANFHFMDNLARSVRYAGKIILSWLPTYYDTERVARIMGEDGTPKMVRLDPNQPEAVREVDFNGKMEKVYNIHVGKYDVTVQTGPGFMTKRQEAVQYLTEITASAKDPATSQVLTYLAVKNNDWAGAEEATKMLKKLLPPGVAEPEDGEEEVPMVPTPQGPVPLPQASEMIAQLMQGMAQAEEQLKKAGDLQQIEQGVKDQAVQVDQAAAQLDAKRAEISSAERELALKQQLAEAQLRNEVLEAQGALKEQGEVQAAQAEETQPAAPQQAPVNIIDSSVAGPLSEVAQSTMAVAQAVAQQSQALADLAAAQRAPRRNRMVLDGETIESVSETVQ